MATFWRIGRRSGAALVAILMFALGILPCAQARRQLISLKSSNSSTARASQPELVLAASSVAVSKAQADPQSAASSGLRAGHPKSAAAAATASAAVAAAAAAGPSKIAPSSQKRSPPPLKRSPSSQKRSPPPLKRSPAPQKRAPPPQTLSSAPQKRAPPPKKRSPAPRKRPPPQKRSPPPPNCKLAGWTFTAGKTNDAATFKKVAYKGSVAALAAECIKAPGCTAFDTSGALKRSNSTVKLSPLRATKFVCNGLYTSANASALIARVLGFRATRTERAAMAAGSKAAAAKAKEAQALASAFQAASAKKPMVDASRLFKVGASKNVSLLAVSTALVLPAYWDSRDPAITGGANLISAVRNQDQCGSCSIFAALAAAEAAVAAALRPATNTYDFSEHDAAFCHPPTATGGSCDEGWYALDAAKTLKSYGVVAETCKPYLPNSAAGACRKTASCPAQPAGSFRHVSFSTVLELQQHIMQHGAVATAYIVYSDFWAFWDKGVAKAVYKRSAGSVEQGAHAVTIVGWDNVAQAWIAKNSWGKTGGEGKSGFFRIGYGEAGIMDPGWTGATVGIIWEPAVRKPPPPRPPAPHAPSRWPSMPVKPKPPSSLPRDEPSEYAPFSWMPESPPPDSGDMPFSYMPEPPPDSGDGGGRSVTWQSEPVTVETYESVTAVPFTVPFTVPWDYPTWVEYKKAQKAKRVRTHNWDFWDYWDPSEDNGFDEDNSHYSDEDGDYWGGWEDEPEWCSDTQEWSWDGCNGDSPPDAPEQVTPTLKVTVTGTAVPLVLGKKRVATGATILHISSDDSNSEWEAAPMLEPDGSYNLNATFHYTDMPMYPGASYDVTLYSFLTAWYDLEVKITMTY